MQINWKKVEKQSEINQLKEQISFLVGILSESQLSEFICFLHNQEKENGKEEDN